MMEFSSVFSEEIQAFLELRKSCMSASGIKHDSCYLESLDAYLARIGLNERIRTEQTITGWIRALTGKTSSRANKIIVIRIFVRFLHSLGVPAFMPVVPKVRDDYIPYIFTDEELRKIFAAADSVVVTKGQTNPYVRAEFPMLLRLLYGCGLRIGETLALRMKDVDLDGGILTMLHTKSDKQRLVPMSPSLTAVMRRYCFVIGIIGVPDAFLFPGADQTSPMSIRAARNKFDVILKNLGLAPSNRARHERGPCMHCFRHVFVFKSFAKAERDGRSITDSVPFLSIYLGHNSLNETGKYLKFSSEMYPEALGLFEDYAESVFPEAYYEE
jgi:integrase